MENATKEVVTRDALSARKARHRWLFAIMGAFFLLSVAVSILLPPRQGPDESDHYGNAQLIARSFRLIPSNPATWRPDSAIRQPPLYYSLAAVPLAMADALFDRPGAPLRAVRLFGAFLGLLWVWFSYRLARELLPKDEDLPSTFEIDYIRAWKRRGSEGVGE